MSLEDNSMGRGIFKVDWLWVLGGLRSDQRSSGRWASYRRLVLVTEADSVVDIDRIANAYNLAEHHQDWETLVWLCHHPLAGRGPTEVQKYIELYGEEFAFVLYQWYIDNGTISVSLKNDADT